MFYCYRGASSYFPRLPLDGLVPIPEDTNLDKVPSKDVMALSRTGCEETCGKFLALPPRTTPAELRCSPRPVASWWPGCPLYLPRMMLLQHWTHDANEKIREGSLLPYNFFPIFFPDAPLYTCRWSLHPSSNLRRMCDRQTERDRGEEKKDCTTTACFI